MQHLSSSGHTQESIDAWHLHCSGHRGTTSTFTFIIRFMIKRRCKMEMKTEDTSDDETNALNLKAESALRSNISRFALSSRHSVRTTRPRPAIEVQTVIAEPVVEPESQAEERPAKKRKRPVADPSVYAHLDHVQDYIRPGLDVLFCGINPGQRTAQEGHHYANPSNHFWKCLHSGGFTDRKLPPSKDHTLPESFNIGLTNLVDRPTIEESELSGAEQTAAVVPLLQKVAGCKPRFVCFVGLNIAHVVFRASAKGTKRKWDGKPGLVPIKLAHTDSDAYTLFFATPSTSGRTTHYQLADKIAIFSSLKHLVQTQSAEVDTSTFVTLRVDNTTSLSEEV